MAKEIKLQVISLCTFSPECAMETWDWLRQGLDAYCQLA